MEKINKSTSAIFALLVLAVLSVNVYALSGSGTEADPYLIQSLSDFNDFVADANYWDDYIRLDCDIDLTGRTYTTAVIGSWLPFRGIFDGNNYIVSNLTICVGDSTNSFLGLFGKIEHPSAEVKNLGVVDCNITSGDNSYDIGGLCGWKFGTISNCYVTGSVSGGDGSRNLGGLCGENYEGHIINCHSTCEVTGGLSSDYLGGLCGDVPGGSIVNCYSTSSVIGGDFSAYLGGLCGGGGGIINCYSTGEVTGGHNSDYLGGLCGIGVGISNSHSTSSVTGGASCYFLGGLCGENWHGTITNCYALGEVFGGEHSESLGGLCGHNYDSTISRSYATGSITGGDNSSRLSGLCGQNSGSSTITNCYALSKVSGGLNSDIIGGLCGDNMGSIRNCYATGEVTGDNNLAGLVGENYDGDVYNCFWDIETSGMIVGYNLNSYHPGTIINVVGKTTVEMQTESTFTAAPASWDFLGEDINGSDDIWRMCVDEIEYPKFWWEFTAGDFTCPDGVNFVDFAVLAGTWSFSTGETSYNDKCDLIDDDTIDFADLFIFINHWLEGVE